jgi:hypothetical protein
MTRRMLLVLTACLATSACTRPPARLPAEPLVTFAAHRDGGGFVVDRMRVGMTGVLESPRRLLHDIDSPDYFFRVDGEPRAALWLIGRSRVLVRESASTIAPRRGDVLSEWDKGAIRLTLFCPDRVVFQTDPFVSRDGRPLARMVTQPGNTPADDVFRAPVRDRLGVEVGWLRVRSPRVYDAVLPPAVDDDLAAAAAVALDTEVAWLAEHGSASN